MPIAPLLPKNDGGAVPRGEYGAVSFFSGNGQYSYINGAANVAAFKIPSDLVIDAAGNIYAADFPNQVVRKVTPDGTVSTFAGTGSGGRDNGPGYQASFYAPIGMAMDAAGNIYVTDQYANEIRKITPSGVVSSLAGNGFKGKLNGNGPAASFDSPQALAFGPDGALYVADMSNHIIRRVTLSGDVTTFAGNGNAASSNGTGAQVSFGSPQGIAFDSKRNCYVADPFNASIRKIAVDGTVTTYAGRGDYGSVDGPVNIASFKSPNRLVFDASDNLYVSDGNRIRKITPTGIVSTVAGTDEAGDVDGTAPDARLAGPAGMVLRNDGILFFGEITGHIIRQLSLTGFFIDKPLPTGLVFDSETGTISGIPTATWPEQLYTITARNKSGSSTATLSIGVRDNSIPPATQAPSIKYDPKIVTINAPITPLDPHNVGGPVPPGGYSINIPLPAGLNFDVNTGIISGTPTVLSPATIYTITARNAAGPSIATLNLKVSDEVLSIAVPPNISYTTPQTLYAKTPVTPIVPANSGGEVLQYSNGLLGNFAGTGIRGSVDGPKETATFDAPAKAVIDANGNFYISDFGNWAVRKITPDGNVSRVAGGLGPGYVNGALNVSQLQGPRGIVADKAGNIYVGDLYSIRKITPAGITSTLAGTNIAGNADGTGTAARFDGISGLAIDDDGNLYATDLGNALIRKISPAGVVTTLAGSGLRSNVDGQGRSASFNNPQDIIYSNGNFYIADYLSVRQLTPGGMVTTIAGNGTPKVLDGPALQAGFGNASAISINPAGDMYIIDIGNNAANEGNAIVRRIDKNNNLSTVSLMNDNGTKVYLNEPNGFIFDSNGRAYVVSGGNVISTLSFDRYTIDKPLPAGLIFDKGTGAITGTPTAVTDEATYTITAYNSGGNSPTSLTLKVLPREAKIPTVIAFPEFVANPVWDANFNIDPHVSSNQTETPIVLTSSNTAVVTINADNTLHILSAGQANITANQAGNDDYLPADAVIRTITIGKADPVISFTPISPKSACDADFSVAGSSTNTVTPITYTSTNPNVATVNAEGMVHIIAEGQTTIISGQAASTLYNEVPESSRTLIVSATNVQLPAPSVSITTPFLKVYEGDNITFTASTNQTAASYRWTVNALPAGTNAATLTTNTLQNQDVVTCTVSFANRCILAVTATAPTVTVMPRPLAIVPPNIFTPNNDGVNDTWKIPALASYPNCRVSIFNRNGTQLIVSRGYSKAWDGTYQGKILPAGVYYYIISPGDGQAAVSGNVTILR